MAAWDCQETSCRNRQILQIHYECPGSADLFVEDTKARSRGHIP